MAGERSQSDAEVGIGIDQRTGALGRRAVIIVMVLGVGACRLVAGMIHATVGMSIDMTTGQDHGRQCEDEQTKNGFHKRDG